MAAEVTVECCAVPMRDGVRLVADIHRRRDGRLPALLLRTPYDRRDLRWRTREVDLLRVVHDGFAVVLQDVRGRGDSGGAFRPCWPDAEDGADTIAWIRAQRWSDGRVMMVGSSYDGWVQLAAARARPAGLVALAPTVTGAIRTTWYPGGALKLAGIANWLARVLREAASDERDAAARTQLEELLGASPLELLHACLEPGGLAARAAAALRHWIAAPPSDAYWTEVTAIPPHPLPAIHTSGWYDCCLLPAIEAYREWSATADPTCPQLLTLGPWDHGPDLAACPDLGLVPDLAPGLADAWERQLAFLRLVRDGLPLDALAPVRSFVLGRNRWHEDTQWPPRGVRAHRLRLTRGEDGVGALRPAALPGPEHDVLRYRYDPRDPAPSLGGARSTAGWSGPLEQARVERRADVLTFTSARLEAELELAGEPLARLLVDSSAPATDFVARLALVLADGASLLLADGIWSGRLADLPPERPRGGHRRCEIALGSIHVAIAPGQRLRLQVTSSSYPEFYPNPNSGHDLALGPPPRVAIAEQSLLLGHSTLELPVRGSVSPAEVVPATAAAAAG